MALGGETVGHKRGPSSSSSASADTGVTTPSPTQRSHLLDDVFGSEEPPSSASVQTSSVAQQLDIHPDGVGQQGHKESADITRLRTIHSTAGYRDGLSTWRESALQPGFDQGYSLGAALGLKAGLVVGSFESLQTAVKGLDNDRIKSQLGTLTARCRKQLDRAMLFSADYIDHDGTWKWQAPQDADLHGVAAAHPVVKDWLLKLDVVLARLGVSMDKLEIRWTEASENDVFSARAATIAQAGVAVGQTGQTYEF